MARALLRLLAEVGAEPFLTSRLRSYDRAGDAPRQERLAALGRREAARIARRVAAGLLPRPDAWVTYHGYHKAPDHLGPALADRWRIPYLMIEASIAPAQARGPWRRGHEATLAGLARANRVLALTEKDRRGLARVVPPKRLGLLRPFLDESALAAAARDRDALAARHGLDPSCPWLLAVAMMRHDVKLESYRVLARELALLRDRRWHLLVVGDGPARSEVAATLATLGAGRMTWLGELPAAALPAVYAAADVLVWPALREAYGLVLLEAQAAGCPVVAGAQGGVPDIVVDGVTGLLVDPLAPGALAGATGKLLDDATRRREMGIAAREHIHREHGTAAAAATLRAALAEAALGHANRLRGGAPSCGCGSFVTA